MVYELKRGGGGGGRAKKKRGFGVVVHVGLYCSRVPTVL